jgi:hypothetical protein
MIRLPDLAVSPPFLPPPRGEIRSHLTYVLRQSPKDERVVVSLPHSCVYRRCHLRKGFLVGGSYGGNNGRRWWWWWWWWTPYLHVEAHQLLVFPLALVESDDNVARKPLDRKAIPRKTRAIPGTLRARTHSICIWERARLDDVERDAPNGGKRVETRRKDVIDEPFKRAKRNHLATRT